MSHARGGDGTSPSRQSTTISRSFTSKLLQYSSGSSRTSTPAPRPQNSATRQSCTSREMVRQEVSSDRFIKIPEEVLEAYRQIGRPTPLVRARRLERFLRTPARIFFKAE